MREHGNESRGLFIEDATFFFYAAPMLKVQFIAFGAASSVYVVREVDLPSGDPGLRAQTLEAIIETVLDGEWPPEAAGFRVLDEVGRQIFPPSGA